MKLYIDDEPLLLTNADLEAYERVLDFRAGIAHSRPHLAHAGQQAGAGAFAAPRLPRPSPPRDADVRDDDARRAGARRRVVADAQPPGRRGRVPRRPRTPSATPPIRARCGRSTTASSSRAPATARTTASVVLGYRCANSGMTLACAYRHMVETSCEHHVETTVGEDLAKTVFTARMQAGHTLRIMKLVTYHTSTGVPAEELADRCHRTLDRAVDRRSGDDRRGAAGVARRVLGRQRRRAARRRRRASRRCGGTCSSSPRRAPRRRSTASPPRASPAAATRATTSGTPRRTSSRSSPTPTPSSARKALRFRWRQLPQARQRARELNQVGALYPWRTITGEEASAYYAAGTAQYHINAAIAFALKRYLDASGDIAFLAGEAAEILVETARLWEDLGFYATNGEEVFRIHGVTGPDEYTTVVNDNFYTNVMARFNMRYAARVVELAARTGTATRTTRLCRRVGLDDDEIKRWIRAADSMYLPYDEALGINPQDDTFLEPRAVGLRQHAVGQVPPAAALPPARDLPPPGAQAGRRGAGDGAAQRPVPARAEAPQLRLLRPDHDR